MTTVRIAYAEPRPGRLANGEFQTRGHLVVLADDARRRALPIWLGGDPAGDDLSQLVESARRPAGDIVTADAPEVFTARLLAAVGASVTEVDIDATVADIDELSPQVTVARIRLAGSAGTRDVTADLGLGLAVAAATGSPVRLADALIDRLAVPVPGDDLLTPFLDRVPPVARALPGHGLAGWPIATLPGQRPRYEPRNLDFAGGLDRWDLDSGFHREAEPSRDYSAAADGECAVLSSAVPRPAGSAVLVQAIYADDYRGATVVFRGDVRIEPLTEQTGLRLEILRHWWRVGRPREDHGVTVSCGRRQWTSLELTAPIPEDADLPPSQIAEPPGAARVSLHKARIRLRAYITEHRPDLVPVARRTHMTTVRIARAERRIPPGPVPDHFPTHVIVLADDAGRRDLPIWLLGRDSRRFSLFEPPQAHQERAGTAQARAADELTGQLLRAAGARVTGVDIDELGPEVTAARIALAGPAGTRHVTARLLDGLALAITSGAPIRVADSVMDRLAVPMGASGSGLSPKQTVRVLSPEFRPRYEPRNMAFADGLDKWMLGGSFTESAVESHWQDYSCAAEHGIAVLSSAVPQPEGFALLAQEMYADDYRDAVVVFSGQVRTEGAAGRAGLCLWVRRVQDIGRPMTEEGALGNPDNHIVMVGNPDWTRHQITVRIPGDASIAGFGIFLAGPGRIELRDAELTRPTT